MYVRAICTCKHIRVYIGIYAYIVYNVALVHLRVVAGLAELTAILNYLMAGNRKAVRE